MKQIKTDSSSPQIFVNGGIGPYIQQMFGILFRKLRLCINTFGSETFLYGLCISNSKEKTEPTQMLLTDFF